MSAFRRFAAELPHVPRALGLAAAASRGWLTAWLVLLIGESLVPAFVVLQTRRVVDGFTAMEGDGALGALAWPLGLLLGALLLGQILGAGAAWARAVQAERVRDHLTELIHEKSLAVDLAFHDAPEFHDRLHRARDAGADGPLLLLESVGSTLQHGVTLISLAAVLAPFGIALPLALVASTVPAAWVVFSTALSQHAWRVAATPRIRRARYLDDLLTQPESAAELRLYGLGDFLRARYRAIRTVLRDETLALERRATLVRLAAGLATLAIAGAATLWIARRAIAGEASLGDVIMLVQAFAQGQRVVSSLLANAGTIYRQALLAAGLFDLLELTPAVTAPATAIPLAPAPARTLRFEHVVFRYPGSERRALDGLDLHVPAGQIAAIVGANGAGKSTLVKLVGRLYDPEEGRITIDGVDLRELDPEALRSELAVLVQEQLRYHGTVAENIALGALDAASDPSRLEAAARAAGAEALIAKLPGGLSTALGRWLGGLELSVGEWQRLGLARASLRRSSIVMLDEPTAAMDSWAEADWLARFRSLAAGRTALIVTHRFTTAMRADVIHVVDGGRVVESGTHAELLARGGRYAQSWRAQIESAVSDPG